MTTNVDNYRISEEPIVSIIMPLYNDELYMKNSLDSLIRQTMKEFEVIIVDDCSTDSSYEIAKEYETKDKRFKVIRHDGNKGGGAARNTGMKYAKGDYLLFLDSDDFFYEDLLEKAYSRIEETGADICCFNCVYSVGKTPKLNFNHQFIPNTDTFTYNDIQTKVFEVFNSVPWNKLYRHSFIKSSGVKWSEIFCSNDVYFVNSLMILAHKITSIDDVLVRYENRTAENSESKYNLYFKDAIGTYCSLRNFLMKRDIFDEHVYKSFISRVSSALNWQFRSVNDPVKKEEYLNWLLDEGLERLGLTTAKFEDYLISNTADFNKYLRLQEIISLKNSESRYLEYLKIEQSHKDVNYCPIAYATNSQYIFPLTVSIVSLLENARENTFCDIYILVSEFSDKQKHDINSITEGYPNSRISFIELENSLFSKTRIRTSHLDKQCFYRLLLPEVLTYIDKIIYLDCDTVICDDLYELFSRNLDKYYVMGVKAAAFMNGDRFEERKKKELHLPSMLQYINSGFMVMNLVNMRIDNLCRKFRELVNNNYDQEDQDVINVGCYDKIRHLPLKYNAMIKYLDPNSVDKIKGEKIYNDNEYNEALSHPIVIHYANRIKPWNDFRLFWSETFFQYAIKSKLFNKEYYDKYDVYRVFKDFISVPNTEYLKHYKYVPDYERQSNDDYKISILLPVYNVENTIKSTLESVVMNVSVLEECELIIVDDCSFDRTLDIVISYAEKFPFIKVYSLDNNYGPGYARNFAISKAKGEFITFMDGDDEYYDYDSLKSLYTAAKSNDALICGGGMSEYKCNIKTYRQYSYPMHGYSFAEDGFIEYDQWQFDYGYHRFIYNRDFILSNKINFPNERRYQDVLFFVQSMHLAKKFYAISKPVYSIKIHEVVFTDNQFLDFFDCLEKVFEYSVVNNLNSLAKLTIERYVSHIPVLRESLIRSSNQNFLLNAQINFIKKIDLNREYLPDNYEKKISIDSISYYYYPFINFNKII